MFTPTWDTVYKRIIELTPYHDKNLVFKNHIQTNNLHIYYWIFIYRF